MDEKINIAKILKNKPEGTKLWTDMFGSVTLYVVTDVCDAFQVKHHNKEPWFDKDGTLYKEGVLCIYPSKSMRDWEKFAWKKGDVLVNSRGLKILFDRWANDNYTSFYAKTINLVEDGFLDTNLHTLASEKEAKSFIKCIEERFGGKLNLQTLEIQKAQPEFKDGDILYCEGDSLHLPMTLILKILPDKMQEYAYMNNETYDWLHICCDKTLDAGDISRLRYATEEEKQHLFNALAKKGKRWDAEKKEVIELKPNVELKPFDKVVARDGEDLVWFADLFSHIDKENNRFACVGNLWNVCLPYNEETAKLIGTTNNVEG